MMRTSSPEHAYASPSNDNCRLRADRWRLNAPRWAAAIALATLLGATTVHALTPPRKFVPTPEFDARIEALVHAIMLMPATIGNQDIPTCDWPTCATQRLMQPTR
jgi:hypothetical protein